VSSSVEMPSATHTRHLLAQCSLLVKMKFLCATTHIAVEVVDSDIISYCVWHHQLLCMTPSFTMCHH